MFVQPVFIRKNTENLRKSLDELGYSHSYRDEPNVCLATSMSSYVPISEEMYDDPDPMKSWNVAGRIDCGTNEQLFLALAALRDGSHKNQWFIYKKRKWFIYKDIWFFCDQDNISDSQLVVLEPDYWEQFHKASVEELIEHFS